MSRKSKRKKDRIKKRREERAKMAEETVREPETVDASMAASTTPKDDVTTSDANVVTQSKEVVSNEKKKKGESEEVVKAVEKDTITEKEPKKLEQAEKVIQIEEPTKTANEELLEAEVEKAAEEAADTVAEETTKDAVENEERSETVTHVEKETEEEQVQATAQKAHHHYHGPRCSLRRKIKSLTSIVILLAGFAVGSLFVDVAQLIAQRGFSSHALDAAQVITYDENTWVKHDEPRVVVDVVVSEECITECEVVNDLLLELRRFVPTLEAHRINLSTPQGRAYKEENNITELPTLIFDENLVRTAFYREAKIMFTSHENGTLLLDLDSLDIPQISLEADDALQAEVKVPETQVTE